MRNIFFLTMNTFFASCSKCIENWNQLFLEHRAKDNRFFNIKKAKVSALKTKKKTPTVHPPPSVVMSQNTNFLVLRSG